MLLCLNTKITSSSNLTISIFILQQLGLHSNVPAHTYAIAIALIVNTSLFFGPILLDLIESKILLIRAPPAQFDNFDNLDNHNGSNTNSNNNNSNNLLYTIIKDTAAINVTPALATVKDWIFVDLPTLPQTFKELFTGFPPTQVTSTRLQSNLQFIRNQLVVC